MSERRERGPYRTETGAPNRPMRIEGYWAPPTTGRGRGDRRHDAQQDQTGYLLVGLVPAAVGYFLGQLMRWW